MLKCALAAGEGSMIQWDRLNAEIFREYLNSLRERDSSAVEEKAGSNVAHTLTSNSRRPPRHLIKERTRNMEDIFSSTNTPLLDMSHSQMLGKFEYTLPAKF